jgi:hypothetical protein
MRKLLMTILMLAAGIALAASAFENWIQEYVTNRVEVSQAEFEASGDLFLAECDSLWALIRSHAHPWDDQFFSSMPNPLPIHAGVYVVTVDYDISQWKPGKVWLAGIGYATHEGNVMMLNSFYDPTTDQVYWVDEAMETAFSEPYRIKTSESDLMEQYASFQTESAKVLPMAEAVLEAQLSIHAIRTVYDRYLQTRGSLKGLSIGAAVNFAGLKESTLRAWQFSVMTQVGDNIPLKFLATCIHEGAPYHGAKVWYDVMEAKYHGMGIDDAVWND